MTRSKKFDGLYSPQDKLWQVNREILIGAAGPRALLLEIAHPAIAKGVVEHSNFATNPIGRLLNTVRVMQLLSFGTMNASRIAAKHNYDCHAHVKGTGYDAADPALRLWVFSTLIDSILLAHDEFIRPLELSERAAYYADSKRMARLLGVPEKIMPPTYAEFCDYVSQVMTNGTLTIGKDAQRIVAALQNHWLTGLGARLALFFGAGMLPGSLREQFSMPWTDKEEWWYQQTAQVTRKARSILPSVIVTQPIAWLTYYRWTTSGKYL